MKIKSTGISAWLFRKLNTTPFDGYLVFKFQVFPHLPRKKNFLNKTYFKFLSVYFVSRIIWNGDYIKKRIEAIKDANMQFGFVVLNKKGEVIQRQMDVTIEKMKFADGLSHYHSGVFNLSGQYIGSIREAYFFARQGYVADRRYPGVFFNPSNNKYYGHTIKGGGSFGIGDKIFDKERGEVSILTLTEARNAARGLTETLRSHL